MAKKKVRVLDAVVDGHTKGDVIEVDANSAEMLVENGYVEYVNKTDEKKSDGDK